MHKPGIAGRRNVAFFGLFRDVDYVEIMFMVIFASGGVGLVTFSRLHFLILDVMTTMWLKNTVQLSPA